MEKYEILRWLGAGGMGMALLARDIRSLQQVVVKLLRPELLEEPKLVRRFLVEAQLLQQLEHSHIIKVLEVADSAGCPFFVMPFAETGSLAQYLGREQPLGNTRLLRWARQIAEALDYAHRQGIIHRDIKPSNVLIDSQANVLLADFGLARSFHNHQTCLPAKGAQHEGTAPYMSPLLANGEAEDTRCDIYAFGALLYEMLTGRPPYQGKTREVLQQILNGPPPPIIEVHGRAPAGLAAVAEAAMARAHRDRYASMGDVVLDLARTARGLPPLGPHAPCLPDYVPSRGLLGKTRP